MTRSHISSQKEMNTHRQMNYTLYITHKQYIWYSYYSYTSKHVNVIWYQASLSPAIFCGLYSMKIYEEVYLSSHSSGFRFINPYRYSKVQNAKFENLPRSNTINFGVDIFD